MHPDFEVRGEQARYAALVLETLERGGVLLAEAPTGLGKTLAYLWAAVEYSSAHDEPVLVATHTRNLQDQIVEGDWPMLASGLEQDFRLVRLKGRENYLCRARVDDYLADPGLGGMRPGMRGEAAVLEDGELARLPEGSLLAGAAGEHDLSAGHCPAELCRESRGCWLRRARRSAQEAQVVVVNHALWLNDRLSGGGILPECTRVILDEAHHLPDSFSQALSRRMTQRGLGQTLDRLLGRPRMIGLIPAMEKSSGAEPALTESLHTLREALLDVRTATEAAAASLQRSLRGRGRLRYDTLADPSEVFTPEVDDWVDALRLAAERARALRETLGGLPPGAAARTSAFLGSGLLRLEEEVETVLSLTGRIAPGCCATLEWAEPTGLVMESIPWDSGAAARDQLGVRVEAAVLTSATLSTAGRMDYISRRLGFAPPEVRCEQFQSEIDRTRQLLALAPENFPDPRDPAFLAEVGAVVEELAGLGRNTMVLCTSWDMLRALARRLEGRVTDLLVQGRAEARAGLAQKFRQGRGGVLLGVQSFWEGVDFPGEALEVLVMPKLPFGVPTDPMFEARRADLESRGGDGFRDLALPEALLRFRQGVGRLLRRREDRGVCVILDRRALGSSYGRHFVEALGSRLERVSSGWAVRAGEFLDSRGED